MFPWYVFTAAFFTAIFYYFDFRRKCDIRYFSHLPYVGLQTILGRYLFLYFIIGLIATSADRLGFSVFAGQESPFEKLTKVIIPGRNPPVWAKNIVLGVIIAWTIRAILSTKIIPLFSGTLDSVIDSFFFKNLQSDQKHNQLEGKNFFIDTQLKRYQALTGSPLTVAEFGNRLALYIEQLEGLDPNQVALVKDVRGLKDSNEIAKAIRICLPILTRTQIKSIILPRQSKDGALVQPEKSFILKPKLVYSGSFVLVIATFSLAVYLSGDGIDQENLLLAESQYAVAFSKQPTSNKTLEDIYRNSNQELIDTLEKQRSKLLKGKNINGSIFLSGVAGEGKSTLIEYLRKGILKDNSITINFKTLINENDALKFKEERNTPIKTAPDSIRPLGHAYDLEKVFSADNLVRHVDPNFKKGFIIIDELHLLSNDGVRSVINAFLKMNNLPGSSTYVIFVGTPDIFNHYLQNGASENAKICFPYSLKDNKFNTFDELKIRVNAYKTTHRQNWNAERVNAITEKLYGMIKDNPYLSYSIQNLSTANRIISKVANSNGSQPELKSDIFMHLLDAAHEDHGRPNIADDELYDVYKAVLMSIAVKYANKIDGSGLFQVRENAKESVTFHGITWEYNTMDILNHSGLVTIEPFNTNQAAYRFHPFWVHRYLVDEHNETQDDY